MRASIALLAAIASMALAVPADEGFTERWGDDEDLPIGEMTFEGPVTPGGPHVTLQGTSESIYNQVMKLNPQYDPWDFAEYAEDFKASGLNKENWLTEFNTSPAKRGLEARQGTIDCSKGKIINNIATCYEGREYLRRLGNARCGANAKKCARISCSNGCGMFFCNRRNNHEWRGCAHLGENMDNIARECGQKWSSSNGWYSVTRAKGRQTYKAYYNELSSQNC